MTDVTLETTNLTKKFGKFTAVDNVSMKIESGETRALIGPNGAGKTTFQNLISGDLSATEGSITFAGKNITSLPSYERAREGIVRKYQENHIYESETVLQNMRIASRGQDSIPELISTRNNSNIEDQTTELLEIANLRRKQDAIASNLSHGEQQWLEIIMCVIANPTLLILDEPTSGMSVGETNDTVQLINDIKESTELSLLVVEHDMEFIKKISNNITVLHRGSVIAEGSINQVENNQEVRKVYLEGG